MSGANELVTALLEDPFVSEEQKQTLRSRWKAKPEGRRSVKIQCVLYSIILTKLDR